MRWRGRWTEHMLWILYYIKASFTLVMASMCGPFISTSQMSRTWTHCREIQLYHLYEISNVWQRANYAVFSIQSISKVTASMCGPLISIWQAAQLSRDAGMHSWVCTWCLLEVQGKRQVWFYIWVSQYMHQLEGPDMLWFVSMIWILFWITIVAGWPCATW